MKQLAQYQDGRLELQEVPVPQAPPGGILVRATCSVISPGTEKMKVEQARMSLLQKAKARPDQVRKVLDTARTLGWKSAYEKVRNRLESPAPLGYSAAGVVEEVSPLNTRFRVGDRVVCGGAECAHHAEFIAVPDMLAAPVPEPVEDWQAAYTTLCAIAMQAVRQTEPGLGERVLVIGQGLVGLLVSRLLVLSGARVMAADLDAGRLAVASQLGVERTVNPAHAAVADHALEWTGGQGVDAVLLCVGGGGSALAEAVIASLRDRGLVVIVGMHDAEWPWKTAYMRDIQVRYSRSYGPGRYDPSYEWGGVDYPIGHVRWTENRNFEACLELMKSGALDVTPLTTRRAAFADAVSVYGSLLLPDNKDIGVVLEHAAAAASKNETRILELPAAATAAKSSILKPVERLNVLGAGNFARTMLLPHLKGRLRFGAVVNATGLSARHVREKFGFEVADTRADAAFGDPAAAVLIATRHHLHAPFVLRGLQEGRHLFVEKPLCLTEDELAEIDAAMAATRGSLMVGFNRRFAPATAAAKKLLATAPGPVSIVYEVCAGPLARDHGYAGSEESGGRVLGEACHFFDFFCHLADGPPVSVSAQPAAGGAFTDSLCAQVVLAGGSTAQLLYTSAGDASYPKESWRVFAGGLVIECENFQKLEIHQKRKCERQTFGSKGHAEEMRAWHRFLAGKDEHPLPYEHSRRSMALTFAALRAARENTTLHLKTP